MKWFVSMTAGRSVANITLMVRSSLRPTPSSPDRKDTPRSENIDKFDSNQGMQQWVLKALLTFFDIFDMFRWRFDPDKILSASRACIFRTFFRRFYELGIFSRLQETIPTFLPLLWRIFKGSLRGPWEDSYLHSFFTQPIHDQSSCQLSCGLLVLIIASIAFQNLFLI